MLGEKLFPAVSKYEPELAEKITGMLLDLDDDYVLSLLECLNGLYGSVFPQRRLPLGTIVITSMVIVTILIIVIIISYCRSCTLVECVGHSSPSCFHKTPCTDLHVVLSFTSKNRCKN